MSDTTFLQSTPTADAEYQTEFESLLQEMTRLDARMHSERADIERLRYESSLITAHTDAMLDQLDNQLERLRRKG